MTDHERDACLRYVAACAEVETSKRYYELLNKDPDDRYATAYTKALADSYIARDEYLSLRPQMATAAAPEPRTENDER